MKIAFVVSSIEVGGVEIHLRTLGDRLSAVGHRLLFIETQKKGRWSGEFRRLGYQVLQITPSCYESKYKHAARIGTALYDSDVVFLHDAPLANPSIGLLPSNVLVIPVLHLKLPGMIDNAIANIKECSQLVTISPALQKNVLAAGKVTIEKVSLICNGVEVNKTYPRNSRSSSFDRLHVGYLGRVEHTHKGVLNIPKILCKYKGEKRSLKFSVIGDGPDMSNLRQALAVACPELEVRYHGFLPNDKAKEILSTFDVLLMPSYYEGLPIALLEAMALGVIPVVSRVPDSTDIVVRDGVNGFVAEPHDFETFASALSRLDNEVELRAKLSLHAWETVENEFNSEKMTEQYINLLARLRATPCGRKCSGTIQTELLGEFANLPIFLGVILRKFRTLWRLITIRLRPAS